MSYMNFGIWQLAKKLVIDIHSRLNILGKKLNGVIQTLEKNNFDENKHN